MSNCNCPHPPGGGGECGANQLAVCHSSGGHCYVSCVDLGDSEQEAMLEAVADVQAFGVLSKR